MSEAGGYGNSEGYCHCPRAGLEGLNPERGAGDGPRAGDGRRVRLELWEESSPLFSVPLPAELRVVPGWAPSR